MPDSPTTKYACCLFKVPMSILSILNIQYFPCTRCTTEISVERITTMHKTELMLDGMNDCTMEVWLDKNCLRSSPGGCNNHNA